MKTILLLFWVNLSFFNFEESPIDFCGLLNNNEQTKKLIIHLNDVIKEENISISIYPPEESSDSTYTLINLNQVIIVPSGSTISFKDKKSDNIVKSIYFTNQNNFNHLFSFLTNNQEISFIYIVKPAL